MDQLKNLSQDVENIPDLKYVIDTLTDIFEYISKDAMIELQLSNIEEYKRHLERKYSEFCDRYYSLFRIVLDGELDSMTHLVMMIKNLCLVNDGKISMDAAYTNVREELSNHYIYPKFGGKKEFEREMMRRNAKNKRNNKMKKPINDDD